MLLNSLQDDVVDLHTELLFVVIGSNTLYMVHGNLFVTDLSTQSLVCSLGDLLVTELSTFVAKLSAG